ncbi:MAG TPA: NUDIX hydrolase [Oscillospiraceae bacterium]|nr:NUDIX hydrolase [Oscillospiraceae bacterium]
MRLLEEKIASEKIFSGHILDLYVDQVRLPNGGEAVREVVRHKGAAAMLALDRDGGVYLVRQFRYPVGKALLELPAGKLEAGEEPLACAKRELLEECGLSAETWIPMGGVWSSPGFCDERLWLFAAKGLSVLGAHPDDDEFLDLVKIPLDEAIGMVLSGEIEDSKSQILLMKAKLMGIAE